MADIRAASRYVKSLLTLAEEQKACAVNLCDRLCRVAMVVADGADLLRKVEILRGALQRNLDGAPLPGLADSYVLLPAANGCVQAAGEITRATTDDRVGRV